MVCDQNYMQNYKSLSVTVMICLKSINSPINKLQKKLQNGIILLIFKI